ncbi:MAG: ATPase [Pseudomonadota bacterium]
MNVTAQLIRDDLDIPRPATPQTIDDTGLSRAFLLDLLMKTIFRNGMERPSRMAAELCLSPGIIADLIEEAKEKQLLHLMGQPGANMAAEMRYQMTAKGRDWAERAMSQNSWFGAAPVPIEAFSRQIRAQTIRAEKLQENTLRRVFSELTLPEDLMHRIGPAVNSGASMLFYGPPGNGKSTLLRGICMAFQSRVYVPHALAVGSEIVMFFDPAVHTPIQHSSGDAGGLRRASAFDPRYVACIRPYVMAGGELSLEKFDLSRNATTGLYEAPLQYKAAGGLFIVDDFGRQRHTPQELINRLIIPLESGVDHLVMESGRKIEVPFDCLVAFATNFEPRSLMDEAGLRRLRHKIMIDRPDRKTFIKILVRCAAQENLQVTEDTLAYILFDLYGADANARFNAFHPRFLIDQCVSICTYQGIEPNMSPETLNQAWDNLVAAH